MKVGIITCHTPLNYGAMLQAYGLQQYLISKQCDPEIINYAPDIFFEELSLFYVGDLSIRQNLLKRVVYLALKMPFRIRRRFWFDSFKKNFLRIGARRFCSFEELESSELTYDSYICGSDQIWNTRGIRGWDPTFYLQFVKNKDKRNSYAASMSYDYPISDKVVEKVFPMICDLGKRSGRERTIVK